LILGFGKNLPETMEFPMKHMEKRAFFIKFLGPKPQAAPGACHCHWRNHRQGTSFYSVAKGAKGLTGQYDKPYLVGGFKIAIL
jgi:hypothetical protein